MSIQFSQVPSNVRVPLFYAEFNNTNAVQGLTTQPYQSLLIGQMTSAGTATANVPVLVSSWSQAQSIFGFNSMLARMAKKYFENNSSIPVYAIPLADNGAGVAATGTLTIAGPATASGTISLYVGGQLVQCGVTSGDTAATIATNLYNAINLVNTLPLTATSHAASSGTVVSLTAVHKGVNGNGIDLRLNYSQGDALPAGVTVIIVGMASGATNPVLTSLISAMADVQYNVIAFPYTDTTSITALDTELTSRSGALRAIEGQAIGAVDDTQGNLTTFGNALNTKNFSFFGTHLSPTPTDELCAALAGLIADSASNDPAQPLQTLQLKDTLSPAMTDLFTFAQRNALLFKGVSTLHTIAGGYVTIERAITTYQTNPFGSPDVSYLKLETLFVLSYLRFSWKVRITSHYPRAKLAADGTRVGPGQSIITPMIAKAEAITIFREWEEAGLVQGADQFKAGLVAVINSTNKDRLDMLLPPNLINQLTVFGTQFQFLV